MKVFSFSTFAKACLGLMLIFWSFVADAQNDPSGNNTNNTIATATTFGGLPGIIGGYLNGGDIDYYEVTIPAGCGVATFKLTGTGTNSYRLDAYAATSFNPQLVNQVVSPDSLKILCGGITTTTIYVAVTYNGFVGNYTLNGYFDVSDPRECNNTFATAYPIALNDSFSAKLWGTNNIITAGTSVGLDRPEDQDFYIVTTTQPGVLNVGINVGTTGGVNPNQNIKVEVYDAPNIANLISSVVAPSYGANFVAATVLNIGTYYIRITDNAPNSYGDYYVLANDPFTITTSYDISGLPEYNNTFAIATPISVDTSFTANLWGLNNIITAGTSVGLDRPEDQDFYRVTTTQPGVLNIGINVGNIGGANLNQNFKVEVYDAPNIANLISSVIASSYGANVLSSTILGVGTYYIRITDNAPNSYGDYYVLADDPFTITTSYDVSSTPEYNNTFLTADLIPVDTTFTAKLWGINYHASDGTTYDRDEDMDFYKITTLQPGVLNLDINVGNVGGGNLSQCFIIEVFDAQYNPLNYVKASGNGANVLAATILSVGTYYIKITEYAPNSYGDFYFLADDPFTVTTFFDTSDIGECNNTPQTADSIALNGIFDAKLWGVNYLISDGTAIPYDINQDQDFFQVTTTQSGIFNVNISGINANQRLIVEIYDSNYTLINNLTGNYNNPNVSLTTLLSVGIYYIKITEHSSNNDPYYLADDPFTITTSFDTSDPCEFNNTFSTACLKAVTDTFTIKINGTNTSNLYAANDIDILRYEPTNCGTLTLKLLSIPLNFTVRMRAYSTAGGVGGDTLIATTLPGKNLSTTGTNPLTMSVTCVPGIKYYFVIDATNGLSNSPILVQSSFVLTGPPTPTIVASPASATICAGDVATLTASGGTTYTWSPPIQNGVSFIPSATTTYTVTATNATGCSNTASTTITVNPLPTTPTITQNASILTCNIASGVTYQWYLGNSPLTGATLQTDTIMLNGSYKVKITTAQGCSAFSNTITVGGSSFDSRINDADNNTYVETELTPNENKTRFGINGVEMMRLDNKGLQIFSPNTYIGRLAGALSTGAKANVAIGDSAMRLVTGGSFNQGIGKRALASLTTGGSNTAIGDSALFSNATGAFNIAIGKAALQNTTTSNLMAIGIAALKANTTGGGNMAIGYQAMMANTTGSNNQAIGYQALMANVTGTSNMSMGYQSLTANTTGNSNMGIGFRSLQSNTTGSGNTGMGYQALKANTVGASNVAIGSSAMLNNLDGGSNVAIGGSALSGNTSGGSNVAIGASALLGNTTGVQNVGIGHQALNTSTASTRNIAIGYQNSFALTTGIDNNAIGAYTLRNATTGNYNTALGNYSLNASTTGSGNTALGYKAGNLRSDYSNSTFVGANADASAAGFTNAMALGAGASVNASNKVIVGNTSVTSIGGQVGWTTFSDKRLKKDIRTSELGLDFITKLNPVTYEYTAEGQKGIRYTGLIAQEVDEAAKGTFSGVDKNGEYWGIRYAELTVPLVKATQEQQTLIETLAEKNTELEADNKAIRSELAAIKTILAQYGQDLQSCCLKSSESKPSNGVEIPAKDGAALEQNIPNPFSQSTIIHYYLPKNVGKAELQFADVHGKVLQTVTLNDRGASSISIDAAPYATGTYFYSLLIDESTIATKKMIVVGE